MANANKVKLPNGNYVSLNDERIHIYRSLTGTAAVTASPYTHAKWDVTDDTVAQYVDGMVVCIKVPVAGHGTYGTGLQINSLGYKPVVYNVSSMVSTRYSVGAVVWAVYNETQTASLYVNSASASTITGCWQVMDYDSNTTSIYTLQRYNGTRVVSADLLRYVIAFRKNETTIVPIHSVAGTGTAANTAVTTTSKTMTTESFDPFGEIYQYATNTKIAANESVNLSTLRTQCANVDARYIFNCAKTLTAQREIYLVVDLQSDGMVKLATSVNPWAQTLPSTNDGHLYILLGYAYSTYQMELYYYHPIYYHDGTSLKIWNGSSELPSLTGNANKVLTVNSGATGVEWTTPSSGSSSLSGLSDTNITSASDDQILRYDGTAGKWVNSDEKTFIVTVTQTLVPGTESEYTYTSDTELVDIYRAIEAGRDVKLRYISILYGSMYGELMFVPYLVLGSSSSPFGIVFEFITGDIDNNNHLSITGSTIMISVNVNDSYGSISYKQTLLAVDITDIEAKKHEHSNKTVLDVLPSSLGTAGQVITVNSSATGVEWAAAPTELPSITGNASKVLAVNSGATGVEWITNSSGLSDYDFTHTATTTVSTSTTTVTFAADQRGSAMLTISADLGLTIACNNGSDNYIWVKNTGSAEVDVTISAVTKNSTAVSNVYMPSDGITVPAGGLCEIGIIVNADGAFITSRNDLATHDYGPPPTRTIEVNLGFEYYPSSIIVKKNGSYLTEWVGGSASDITGVIDGDVLTFEPNEYDYMMGTMKTITINSEFTDTYTVNGDAMITIDYV